MLFPHAKLNFKIQTILLVLLLVLCAVSVSVGITAAVMQYGANKHVREANAWGETVYAAVLQHKTQHEMQGLLNSFYRETGVRVYVLDAEGIIRCQPADLKLLRLGQHHIEYSRLIQAAYKKPAVLTEFSESRHAFITYSGYFITDARGVTGTLVFERPVLQQYYYVSLGLVWGSLLCVFGLAGFFAALYIGNLITLPVRTILEAGTHWSVRDFSYRMPLTGDSELAALCEKMNIMAEKINDMLIRDAKLESMRKDFVANVSHELRTPITLIRGYSEVLEQSSLQNKEKTRGFLSIITKSSIRMEHLITDLLSLSKLENAADMADDFIPLDVSLIVQTVQTTFLPAAEKKQIILQAAVKPLFVMGGAGLIETALSNLVDNAVKYSLPHTTVTIEVFRQGSNVAVSVSDQGGGIPEKDLPRLFERFYRVDRARSRALGGTGLGLAIVKHIMLAHSGTYTVKSSTIGSQFTLLFPIYDAVNNPQQED